MAPAPRRPDRLAGRALTSLAVGGMGVVLAVFAALLIGSALGGTSAARDVERSADLAEAYLSAQDALSRADTIEDVFKAELDIALEEDFAIVAHDFERAIAQLARAGADRDQELARRALELHSRYAWAMRDSFAAARRGELDAVEEINEQRMDPAQDALQPLINSLGPRHAKAQLARVHQMQHDERRVLDATLVVVPVGAALYLLLVLVFAAQRRRLDRLTRAEVLRLDEAAHTDSLTGLLNRRALHRDLAELEAGTHAAAMLDVVGLKAVNDRDGHVAGDALLQRVAGAVHGAVAGRGSAYRVGGDEFALVLPGHDAAQGHAVLEAVRQRVVAAHPAGIRGGVAAGARDPFELVPRASTALVQARRCDAHARAA